MGQMPTVVGGIMSGWPEGVLEGWGRHPDRVDQVPEDEMERSGPRTNGIMTNGIAHAYANENENYGWEGGAAKDRDQLFSLLDDCLAMGR